MNSRRPPETTAEAPPGTTNIAPAKSTGDAGDDRVLAPGFGDISERARPNPPAWLILSTGTLAVTCLVLAIAETSLWAHYLIGGGEFLSVLGLCFILIAGLRLFRRQRLFVSLPLVFPWLLYPVITQGDEIIDNLSINWMRLICQVLLAAIFITPIAVVVIGARYAFSPRSGHALVRHQWLACLPGVRWLAEGRTREGSGVITASLLAIEVWIAHMFLGTLMVTTLVLLIVGALIYTSLARARALREVGTGPSAERFALIALLAGVSLSGGLYLGFKNRPGAYQGSPSAFMDRDRERKNAAYPLDRISVPTALPVQPANPEIARQAFASYSQIIQTLFSGYRILDRNYTYDFHNRLFLKNTLLITNYRAAGLQQINEAMLLRPAANSQAAAARSVLGAGDPLAALLDELGEFLAYNFERAPVLERMSGAFEQTPAGLQHAAHLYEGECKAFGSTLEAILKKHHAVLESPDSAAVVSSFASASRAVYEAYARHVVGF